MTFKENFAVHKQLEADAKIMDTISAKFSTKNPNKNPHENHEKWSIKFTKKQN